MCSAGMSPVRSGRGLIVLLLAACFGPLCSEAIAQTAPRSLLPGTLPSFDQRRTPDTEPSGSAATSDGTATPSAPPAPSAGSGQTNAVPPNEVKSGIVVNQLGAPTVDEVGILGEGEGGFPVDAWLETPRPVIARLFGLLPGETQSPVGRDLQRRLLLSAARVRQPEGAEDAVSGDLMFARLDALARMGALGELSGLVAAVPGAIDDDRTVRTIVDTALLRGDYESGCATARERVGRATSISWQKAVIFCDAMAGATERAEFGARLLVELGEQDPVFFGLLAALGGQSGPARGIEWEPVRPIDVAMAQAAGVPLPSDVIEALAPMLISPVLANPATPFQDRMVLAERGERLGVVLPRDLASLYRTVDVDASLLDSAISVAEADPGPNARALLFEAAALQDVDLARAQAIEKALEIADKQRSAAISAGAETAAASFGGSGDPAVGGLLQTARLYAPSITALNPSSELGWFAPTAVKALLAAGRLDDLGPWVDLARAEARLDEDVAAAYLQLWPLLRIADQATVAEREPEAAASWWALVRTDAPERAVDRAETMLALSEALDDPLGDAAWRSLISLPTASVRTGAAPAIRRAMDAALAAGRTGEAVALSALVLGAVPASGDLLDLVSVVSALRFLGLEGDARALAVEIAFLRGV